jgi:hypothetical protein
MFILNLPLIENIMICMQVTLEGLWMSSFLPRERLALSFFLVPTGCAYSDLSLAFLFCLQCVGSDHHSFIGIL